MKKINRISIVVLALVALCWGCSSESVGPKDGNSKPVIAGSANDEHPVLDPVCGNAKTFALVSEDGSTTINRCFGPDNTGNQPIACGPNMAEWGSVTMMNGLTEVIANFTLAEGWFATMQYDRVGDAASFTFDANGFPEMTQDWIARAINPVVGKWQVARSLNTTGDQFAMGTKVIVAKLNDLGEVIAGSATNLWLKDLAAPTSSPSPYLANWTRNFCAVGPTPQNICKSIFTGSPQLPTCTNLVPAVAATNGPLTYAWSNGGTSSSLSVCPTANTTYTVSVSDSQGPRAIINYNVSLVNITCGNNKVRVCHFPPGNPANGNEQCVNATRLASILSSLQNAGSGANAGYKIGPCNDPCN